MVCPESAIMVATRSRVLPSPGKDSSLTSMDLTLPLNLEIPSSEPDLVIEWDTWGEESSIELCEVRLDFDGMGEQDLNARTLYNS